ncbi:MAG TPA: RNA polymerase factor sigma-54 [Tissierellaceae bacterium]|nr:RNA polymerase factor sigma-54 [Tissierellaceae bacterium]
MKLGFNIRLEQSQRLIMTPELRQAIQLLQYNSLELNEYLKNEIEENPLLEMENPNNQMEETRELTDDKDVDWKEVAERYDDFSYKAPVDKNQEEYNYEAFTTYTKTLKEFLIEQLNLTILDDKEYLLGDYIIQNIDENGYLDIGIEEIAEQMNSNVQEVEDVLKIIQTFEPLGVGARDLKECLLIQIREKGDVEPNLVKIIDLYLDDLACNRMIKIAKELNIDLNEMQEVCDYIKTLEPKPGRAFSDSGENVKYIIPDASIEEIEGEYVIIINDITGPRLNINSYYRNLLKHSSDEDTTNYLSDKLNSAMWVIQSIEQRKQTIYKVIESILKFQIDFFKSGEKGLVPLTLKEVADEIDMHESTVSRATNGKFVQTPRGLFELKFFFTSGLPGLSGEISSTSIKSEIKGIIDNEDSKKPLSDQAIADILKEKGASISRRTVAKYRDELNIPSSSKRKRYV